MTHASVIFQVDPTSVPCLPSWMEEVAVVAQMLTHSGIRTAIEEHVQFARARFGTYDTIDFVIVLLSYALSGERTLAAFYERLAPFTQDFLAVFERQHLPSRSALSRFLAALDEPTVEALRTQFLHDLLERATPFSSPGGVWDRLDQQYVVVDVDGTRQVARQRALPHLPTLPEPQRRFAQAAASGYTGRKRGEVVRTRTTVLQAHTHQWLGTFGGAGNGHLREELRRACLVASAYASKQQLHPSQILLRLDGAYGDSAVLSAVLPLGLGLIVRSRDYALLGRPEVLAVLAHAPAARCTHPESGVVRDLYDCPAIRLVPTGPWVRLLIATHPATDEPPSVGQQRNGLVYELFVSTVLAPAMSANDLLDLYLHRGSFEPVLADEDLEQGPDRWCSHSPCGQEFWQILSQWIWNLRLEFGQHCTAPALRTTVFASANGSALDTDVASASEPGSANGSALDSDHGSSSELSSANGSALDTDVASASEPGYGPAQWARPSFTGGFPGSAFRPQADGTLLCPASCVLTVAERRQERAGSLRVSYAASLDDCGRCPLRTGCQKSGTAKARRVSVVYWPLSSQPLPLPESSLSSDHRPATGAVLWRDWPRCQLRRQWMKLVRSQSVEITRGMAPGPDLTEELSPPLLTRPQRAHWRLSWEQRLSRNARRASAPPVTITLHGLPVAFAQIYGFALRAAG